MHFIKTLTALLAFGPIASLSGANQVQLQGHNFTLPEGFTIEVAASTEMVPRPIVADFDHKGRLYVADSSGSNERVEVQLMSKPHRILRLEDSNGDGVFDKQTVFADKMMFPEGVLYHDGAVYVGAPPTIWKLEDKDDDGVAEVRTEWFKQAALSGCANEIHGPYLGLDGLIYWCKGGFSKLNLTMANGKSVTDRAAHIFRVNVDGSNLESLMAGGMDNPVELVFTPGGEAIFTTTFYTNPAGGQRDGLVHAVYGGVYPKVHDVIDGLKRTGELMPILTHLGPAAPSGLARYESKVFGNEFQNNLFSTSFNLHKVFRHELSPKGGTFSSRDSDFLVSDSVDFHPTDVLEDADGSLLVVDTGGWYKLCCPTSQLAKPDVLGGIYRIRKTGSRKVEDPRGTKLNLPAASPTQLVKHLDDPRPMVQKEVLFRLGQKGTSAMPQLKEVLKNNPSPEARRNAIWALTRISGEDARQAVRSALQNTDDNVKQIAARSAGLWRDAGAVEALIPLLQSKSELLVTATAEALGRIGKAEAVPALLQAAETKRERVLEHALIYALIEINSPEKTRTGLENKSPHAQRAALIALDQMDAGDLRPEEVSRLLSSRDKTIRDTAMWVALRHPDWGANFAEYFRTQLYNAKLSETDSNELLTQLASFGKQPAIQEIMISVVSRPETPMQNRYLVLKAMKQIGLREIPEPWIAEFKDLLSREGKEMRERIVAVIHSTPLPKDKPSPFQEELRKIAADEHSSAQTRLQALEAVGTGESLSPSTFSFLISQLDKDVQPSRRSTAAAILSRSKLAPEQLSKLAEVIRTAGPLEITTLLGAFEAQPSAETGKLLLTSLGESKSFSAIRPETLRARLKKFPEEVQASADKLLSAHDQDLESRKNKLEELTRNLTPGDIRRGQAIFNSTATACVSCHAVGYVGGTVGPDLTRVGAIRTEKDLLESIVFPSASFVRSYEPMLVQTKDGEQHIGIPRRETDDLIVLAAGAGVETQIPRNEISEMKPGSTSIMPEGLDQQLNQQQLSDLVAFLKSLK